MSRATKKARTAPADAKPANAAAATAMPVVTDYPRLPFDRNVVELVASFVPASSYASLAATNRMWCRFVWEWCVDEVALTAAGLRAIKDGSEGRLWTTLAAFERTSLTTGAPAYLLRALAASAWAPTLRELHITGTLAETPPVPMDTLVALEHLSFSTVTVHGIMLRAFQCCPVETLRIDCPTRDCRISFSSLAGFSRLVDLFVDVHELQHSDVVPIPTLRALACRLQHINVPYETRLKRLHHLDWLSCLTHFTLILKGHYHPARPLRALWACLTAMQELVLVNSQWTPIDSLVSLPPSLRVLRLVGSRPHRLSELALMHPNLAVIVDDDNE